MKLQGGNCIDKFRRQFTGWVAAFVLYGVNYYGGIMAKRARRAAVTVAAKRMVFEPTQYEVTIGENDYLLAPQPIAQIRHFDQVVSNMFDSVGDFGKRHYVVELDPDGQEVGRQGPLHIDDAEAALAEMNGNPTRIESDPFDMSALVDGVLQMPYGIMKLLIPDLEESDCEQLSAPELTWLTNLLIEVNGLDWFRAVVKNLGEPLLAELGAALADWIRVASLSSYAPVIANQASSSTETDLTNL